MKSTRRRNKVKNSSMSDKCSEKIMKDYNYLEI